MKKKVLLLATIVALIVGAGIAYAASSDGGLPGRQPAVWGGGHFTLIYEGQPYGRDFSIVATPGGGKWVYGLGGSGPRIVGPVTCMRVSDNHVVYGGIIREDPYNPEYVGMWFIGYMTDNGRLAETTPDQVSGNYLADKSSIGWNGITKYFPYVCPAFSMASDLTMFNLESGDIVVQNPTQNDNQATSRSRRHCKGWSIAPVCAANSRGAEELGRDLG